MTARTNPKRNERIDMSAGGVDRRLRELADLYRFWIELENARRRGELRVRPSAPR